MCFLLLLSATSCVRTLVSGAVSRVWNMILLHDSDVRWQPWLTAAWCDIFPAMFPHISTLNSGFSANKKQQTTLALSALILMECDVRDRSWMQFKIGLDGNCVQLLWKSLRCGFYLWEYSQKDLNTCPLALLLSGGKCPIFHTHRFTLTEVGTGS